MPENTEKKVDRLAVLWQVWTSSRGLMETAQVLFFLNADYIIIPTVFSPNDDLALKVLIPLNRNLLLLRNVSPRGRKMNCFGTKRLPLRGLPYPVPG